MVTMALFVFSAARKANFLLSVFILRCMQP